jgi:hypothetical protein
MSAGKIVGYVISGILILFGVLFLLSAFAPDTGVNPVGRLVVGVILVGIGSCNAGTVALNWTRKALSWLRERWSSPAPIAAHPTRWSRSQSGKQIANGE